MPSAYIPILIFAVLAAAFPAVTLVIMKYIRPDSTTVGAKLRPYREQPALLSAPQEVSARQARLVAWQQGPLAVWRPGRQTESLRGHSQQRGAYPQTALYFPAQQTRAFLLDRWP